jgi:hypothetical protein
MHPLIRDDQPARLPLRGPLEQPTATSTPLAVQQVLDENTQLLLLAEEVMNGKLEGLQNGQTDVKDAVPILERLQRNLIYLALLADQKPANRQPTLPPAPINNWTHEELELLKESVKSFGENLETLGRIIRTKTPEAINAVLEQWRRKH